MPKIKLEFVKKETDELLKFGFIEERVSDWASPIMIVKKSNGKLRMCVDYKKLNAATIDEKFPGVWPYQGLTIFSHNCKEQQCTQSLT